MDNNRDIISGAVGLRLTIRQLTVFETVVEQSSIAAAARMLNLTQPAVSKSIIDMEASLGVSLFKRTRQGVIMTVFGQSLLLHSRAIHAVLRNAANDIRALSLNQGGHVVVGVSGVTTTLLSRAILNLRKIHPNIRITILDGTQDYLLTELGSGRIDFVLGRLAAVSAKTGLVRSPLIDDEVRVFVRQGHPLIQHSQISISDLTDFGWILPLPTSFVRSELDDVIGAEELAQPPALVETASINVMRNLMMNSDMIVFTPSQAFLDELENNQLVILPVDLGKDFSPIGVTKKRNMELSYPAQLLHDFFVAEVDLLLGDTGLK